MIYFMTGYLYRSGAVNIFVENHSTKRIDSVVKRFREVCEIRSEKSEQEIVEHLKKNIIRGTLNLENITGRVIFKADNGEVIYIPREKLAVQTLKEQKNGLAWIERSKHGILVYGISRNNLEPVLYKVCSNIYSAIDEVCRLSSTGFLVNIHEYKEGFGYYEPIATAKSLRELAALIQKFRHRHILISALVSWGGSNTSVHICRVRDRRVIFNENCNEDVALKYNKVFKKTIMPEIIKVIKKECRRA